ncbi:hypothetical protein [Loktanella sp. M215]|uniref:hypothetical protein n=1 Tax=Loktanella sp. M215 TaxID=2675431 RepID=UPI001F42F62C|nr:hypothetical protein [Loktanella sp. M215]MCF7699380.1 hypothetical protein [Loktanella sp. M215]
MFKRLSLSLAVAGLSACGFSSSGGLPFSQPDIVSPSFTVAAGQLAISTGGGIQFTNRIDPVAGNIYAADIRPGAVQEPTPTTGRASMTGPFALRQATGLQQTGGTYAGRLTDHTGAITLNADFGAGTLRGAGDGLTVDGRMTTGTLSGSASYGGVRGDLDGFVGATNAIGAFGGQTATSSIAGGFVVAQ